MVQPVTVAIIGSGNMAREHVRAFQAIPGVTVAGIHSRTRARAQAMAAEYGIGLVAASVEELFHSTNANLVVVAVVELSMKAVACETFNYPWTVLLEKPAGYELEDALAIADAAHEKQRRVYVALNRRMYSSTRAALGDLASNSDPRFIRIEDQQDQRDASSAGQPPPVVANWMFANSIHLIDYLRVFGRGEIMRVETILPWDPARPGIVLSRIDFSSGDIGLYEGIWNGPGPWSVTVSTPSKRWEMRPLEQARFQLRGERRLHDVEPSEEDRIFKPGLFMQAKHAVASVRGEPSALPTIDDALASMHLVQSIFHP